MKRNHFFQLLAAVCPVLGCFPVWYWFCQWQLLPRTTAFLFLGVNFVLMVIAWVHRRYTVKLEQKSLLLAGYACQRDYDFVWDWEVIICFIRS